MRSEAIEAAIFGGARLRIEFAWRNDRYGHVISFVNAAGESAFLLESIEGSDDDGWPSSPPLQSLSIENLPDGRSAALLVGMAGRSHWSASVEPNVDQSGLTIDIACRHSQESKWLGNRYRRLSAAAEDLLIEANGADVAIECEYVSIRPLTAACAVKTTRWQFAMSMRPAAVHPAPAAATEPPR
jgi:hypothetical protein